MFREFNIKFEDVEMLGGSDNLLEGSEVTKVILRGENNFSSLDSMLKNCNELDTIDGDINLKDVTDIDNLLEGTNLIKTVNLANVNNENMSINKPFANVNEINIGGEIYDKRAIQNVIASKDWTYEGFKYKDKVGLDVTTKEINVVDDNKVAIQDTLEQKAKGIEVIGQTYENLIEGKDEASLMDELSMESVEGSPKEFNPHIEQPICVEVIEGQTYQNLIEGKGEYKLTDTFSTTWTESNNSIDNPPSMIEIPEIFGNTFQGYANVVTSEMIVDSMYNTGINTKAEVNDDGSILVRQAGMNSVTLTSNEHFIQLKPNTTYSVRCYSNLVTYSRLKYYLGDNLATTHSLSDMYHLTTDSSGKILIHPETYQNGNTRVRIVEGQVDLSQYDYDEMDLNYIQSVGDLYVDKNGEAILDEEGNEQYRLDIINKNINLMEYNEFSSTAKNITCSSTKDGVITVKSDGSGGYQKFNLCTGDYGTGLLGNEGMDMTPIITGAGTYNFSFKHSGTSSNTITLIVVYDNNKTQEFYLSHSGRYNITANKCINNVQLNCWYNGNVIDMTFSELQITKSTSTLDYVKPQSNKTTILMSQPLRRITTMRGSNKIDKIDRLYWDSSKGKYILEQNIKMYNIGIPKDAGGGYVDINFPSDMPNSHNDYNSYPFILEGFKNVGWNSRNNVQNDYAVSRYSSDNYVLVLPSELTMEEKISLLSNKNVYYWVNEPQYIETKILEKPSLETYSPKTYISTNSEVQPSQMAITNKKSIFSTMSLQANIDYTLQLDSIGKNNKNITVNLGGTETTIQPTNDTSKHHKVVIRTPATLTNETLELSGEGVVANDVMLFQGGSNDIKQEVGYVEGIESIGEDILNDIHDNIISWLDFNDLDNSINPTIWIDKTGKGNDFILEGFDFDGVTNGVVDGGLQVKKGAKIKANKTYNNIKSMLLCVNPRSGDIGQIDIFGTSPRSIRCCFREGDKYPYIAGVSGKNITNNKSINTTNAIYNLLNNEYNILYFELNDGIENVQNLIFGYDTNSLAETTFKSIMLFDKKLNDGEIEDLKYLCFNPDVQYKIDILTDNLYVNKFDLLNANISNINCNYEKLQNGIKVYSSSSGTRYIRTFVNLKKNTLYYIKYNLIDVLNTNSGKLVIGGYNGDSQVFASSAKGTVEGSFVANSDILYILMYSNSTANSNPQEIVYSDIIISETPIKKSTQSIPLPQPLNKIGDIKDKFYWDEDKGHYCIEQNIYKHEVTEVDSWNLALVIDTRPNKYMYHVQSSIDEYNKLKTGVNTEVYITSNKFTNVPPYYNGKFTQDIDGVEYISKSLIWTNRYGLMWAINSSKLEGSNANYAKKYLKSKLPFDMYFVLETPNIIDLPHLNKKYSLNAYVPTTYLECTNTSIQPSKLLLESNTHRYKPTSLKSNTEYTVQFDCKEKGNKKVVLDLGGTRKEFNTELGLNHVSITTNSELTKDRLYLSGEGNTLSEVMLVEGNMNQYPSYFDGVQSVGELQEDGSYKIDMEISSEHIYFGKNDCIPFVSGDIWYNDLLKNKAKVVPNAVYHALVYDAVSESLEGLQVRCYSKDGTFIEQIDTSSGKEPRDQGRFTVPQDCYYINFRMYTHGITGDLFSDRKIILYKGSLDDVISSKNMILEKVRPISKLGIVLSQALVKVGDIADRLYWDKNKKNYCIEKKVGEFSLDNTILNNGFKDDSLIPNHKVIMVDRGTLGIDCSSLFSDVDFICDKIPVVRFTTNSLDHKLFVMKGSNDLRLGIRKDIYNSIGEEESKKMFLGKIYYYPKDNSNIVDLTNVEGDVIDLPRLFQRVGTNIEIETGNIKPSNVKIEYLDID